MALRAECQIQMAEVSGSMLTGVTFYSWIFLFLHIHKKASEATIANFVCL